MLPGFRDENDPRSSRIISSWAHISAKFSNSIFIFASVSTLLDKYPTIHRNSLRFSMRENASLFPSSYFLWGNKPKRLLLSGKRHKMRIKWLVIYVWCPWWWILLQSEADVPYSEQEYLESFVIQLSHPGFSYAFVTFRFIERTFLGGTCVWYVCSMLIFVPGGWVWKRLIEYYITILDCYYFKPFEFHTKSSSTILSIGEQPLHSCELVVHYIQH